MDYRSLVSVQFDCCGIELDYYNDSFDLKEGDIVFVDGQYAGQRGTVTSVSFNFKIKLSDYKKIIAKADTSISGTLHSCGKFFISFNPETIPYEKVITWFSPESCDEYIIRTDDQTLYDMQNITAVYTPEIANRGRKYCDEERVQYICFSQGHVKAVVDGKDIYEVEFDYDFEEGLFSHIVCDCRYSGHCKHEYAVLLQITEIVDIIKNNYRSEFSKNMYFAAVLKDVISSLVLDNGNCTAEVIIQSRN